MLNWFKRKKSYLQNWRINDLPGFDIIQNPDSLQYVNEDASKVIYFSILNIIGKGIFSNDFSANTPTIIEEASGWQVKGSKKSGNQILICVITIVKQEDIAWANAFFDAIESRNHSN